MIRRRKRERRTRCEGKREGRDEGAEEEWPVIPAAPTRREREAPARGPHHPCGDYIYETCGIVWIMKLAAET